MTPYPLKTAWMIGVSAREYRELEAGKLLPDSTTWAMRHARMARSPRGGRLVNDEDAELRDLLRTLSPPARQQFRDVLCDVLFRDQADRDLIAARLLRFRNVRGTEWAYLVDELSFDPELRRRCVRLLGELRVSPS